MKVEKSYSSAHFLHRLRVIPQCYLPGLPFGTVGNEDAPINWNTMAARLNDFLDRLHGIQNLFLLEKPGLTEGKIAGVMVSGYEEGATRQPWTSSCLGSGSVQDCISDT